MKFGTEERTCGPLPRAKFHVNRGNVSPLRGEKPIFGPLSKTNTGMAALRAGLTVIMIFPPKDKRKVVTSVFPWFKMNNLDLKYVDEFKYLGHIISNNERDENDVVREVRAMFTRTNILARRFSSCSVSVKSLI